jgi:hypothetical protein
MVLIFLETVCEKPLDWSNNKSFLSTQVTVLQKESVRLSVPSSNPKNLLLVVSTTWKFLWKGTDVVPNFCERYPNF